MSPAQLEEFIAAQQAAFERMRRQIWLDHMREDGYEVEDERTN